MRHTQAAIITADLAAEQRAQCSCLQRLNGKHMQGLLTFAVNPHHSALNLHAASASRKSGNALPQGLLTSVINIETGEPWNELRGMGAGSDSYYEYLLKLWLLGVRFTALCQGFDAPLVP